MVGKDKTVKAGKSKKAKEAEFAEALAAADNVRTFLFFWSGSYEALWDPLEPPVHILPVATNAMAPLPLPFLHAPSHFLACGEKFAFSTFRLWSFRFHLTACVYYFRLVPLSLSSKQGERASASAVNSVRSGPRASSNYIPPPKPRGSLTVDDDDDSGGKKKKK